MSAGFQTLLPVDRTPERREHAELVEGPESVRREAAQLGENALAGRLGDKVRVLPHEALRLLGKLKAELVREPDRAQEPQRVVFEDRLRDRAKNPRLEVGCSAKRIH